MPYLSRHLGVALVVAEDHRFWRHSGIDVWAIGRAIIRIVMFRKLEGASTIEQQLIRVTSRRHEITLPRKVREVVFAIALGAFFKKEEVVVLYLGHGYYGCCMSGLSAACARLGIDPALATAVDAARLVARLRYPEPVYDSSSQRQRIDRRVGHILNRLGQPARLPGRHLSIPIDPAHS
jgi:penicillin-binding protein 1A